MIVRLTDDQAAYAIRAGNARQANATRLGLKDVNGPAPATYEEAATVHCDGYACEIAVSVALGFPLPDLALEDFRTRADVGGFCDVRGTKYRTGHLLIYQEDKDERPYVLVTGTSPEFRICGWIFGKEGKRKEWFRLSEYGARPAHYVPQPSLRPFSLLFDLKDERVW